MSRFSGLFVQAFTVFIVYVQVFWIKNAVAPPSNYEGQSALRTEIVITQRLLRSRLLSNSDIMERSSFGLLFEVLRFLFQLRHNF